MFRVVILCSLVFGIEAFAATKSSTKSTNKSAAVKNQQGKTALKISSTKPGERPYKIVPMVGVASFRLQGAQGLESIRADEGLALSLLGDYDFRNVTLQGGLSYYQIGARGNIPTEFGPFTSTVNIEYLAINTGAKYYFMNRQIYAKGGLSPMFKVRSEVKATSPIRTTAKLHNVRDMDLLMTLGGGVELPFYKDVKVGGELTYNRGLIDASTHGNGEVFNEGFLFSAFLNL